MKTKLIVSIICFVVGLIVFLGIHQYLGGAIIAIGIFMADLYADERKLLNKNIKKKHNKCKKKSSV